MSEWTPELEHRAELQIMFGFVKIWIGVVVLIVCIGGPL